MTKHHASKFKGLIWVVVGCLLGLFFAAGISPLAHLIPWSWEKRWGHSQLFAPTISECPINPQAQLLFNRLVQRIYPIASQDNKFSIEVHIAQDPAVNAYAGLGGFIVVNSALLRFTESPEELSGILAHEIEHVQHRHIMQRVLVHLFTYEGLSLIFGGGTSAAQWSQVFLNMNFTRGQEAQADASALKRLQLAHVDNHGFQRFFERMKDSGIASEFFSDHPSNESRLEMAKQYKNENVTSIMTPAEWGILKGVCGKN